MVYVLLFTFRSHYYSLSILSLLTLEIDFPVFNRRSSFYGLLKSVTKHVGFVKLGVRIVYGEVNGKVALKRLGLRKRGREARAQEIIPIPMMPLRTNFRDCRSSYKLRVAIVMRRN